MDGIINVLKPPGMTSHDVVSFIRKKTGIKRVGHTGTLDPYAAGVLPICIGKATKVSQFLLDSKKKYRTECTLGLETDTEDIYGTVINQKTAVLSEEEIRNCIHQFIGEYDQIPPMYSALKVKGKKLYEFARQGIEIERKPRKAYIYHIDIIKITGKVILFDVECSKGTYVRTLCKDIGDRLKCGGVMSFLLRTGTGVFDLSTAVTIEEIKKTNNLEPYLFSIDYPLTHLPKVLVSRFAKNAAFNGNRIDVQHLSSDHPLIEGMKVRVYFESLFIGVAIIKRNEKKQLYIQFSRLFI